MKKLLITILILTVSIPVIASQTIKSLTKAEAKIDLSKVVATKLLAENKNNGRKVIAVIVDQDGSSTDMSDRFITYLVFQQFQEMLNIRTAFKLGRSYNMPKLKKIKPGVYSFKANSVEGAIDLKVITYNLYKDLKKLQKSLKEFEDSYLNTSIELTK